MAAQKDNLSGWILQHVTKVNDCIRCNICEREYRNKNRAIHMKVHLYHVHKIYNVEERLSWENNDLLRQYFSKKNLFTAKCKICDTYEIASTNSGFNTPIRSNYQYQRRNVLDDHLNEGNNINNINI